MQITNKCRLEINSDRYTLNKKAILRRITAGIFILLFISGCAAVTPQPGPELGPAPLPTYTTGVTFVYSDGRWNTVTATFPEVVTWSDDRGNISYGSPDFTYRPARWRTQSRSVTRQFGPREDLATRSAATLWPLRVGNISSYSETGTWTDADGTQTSYRTDWSCAVTGTERVSVMAGDFDTFRIVCRRYYVSRSKNTSRLREEKTWNYAPGVGHYVLATAKYYYDKKSWRQELLAVLPPLNGFPAGARRQMEQSFQQALEHKKSGQSVRWTNAGSKISVEIKPTKTFKAPDGTYSRRYVQKFTLPDGQKTYYGMASRGPDGVWTVPRR